MFSAICFNLDQSKILLSSNALKHIEEGENTGNQHFVLIFFSISGIFKSTVPKLFVSTNAFNSNMSKNWFWEKVNPFPINKF